MKLLYISEDNLKDRLFIRDLVFNYKLKDKALLIHESFNGSVEDTRFVTKRISALLSEQMIYNNAFSGERRNFFSAVGDVVEVNTSLILQLLETVQLLIISPVIKQGQEDKLMDPLRMAQAALYSLPIENSLVFTQNPLSPLAANRTQVEDEAQCDQLFRIYDEERAAIQRAYELRPSILVSPTNYGL